jgi:hypothetical protein
MLQKWAILYRLLMNRKCKIYQTLHTSSTPVTVCIPFSVDFTRLWFCCAAGSGEVIVLRAADPLTELGRFIALLENLESRFRFDVTIE